MVEFSQISILLVAAAVCASVAKLLKQSTLIGYIIAGFVLSAIGVGSGIEVFSGLSQIGITLLLFLVGIEMNLKEIPIVGKFALTAGIGQIVFTSLIGFVLSAILGYGVQTSLYIAIALTFSSTIIIVKLLSEKRDLDSLYGRISLGVLLVQDLLAVLVIMFLSGLKSGVFTPSDFLFVGIKAVILILATWYLSKKILPNLFDKFLATNQELLFISSIAWALGVSAFVEGVMGFTLEIGGFLAGLALSGLPEHLHISSRTKPLRDFFLTIFFILLGTSLSVGELPVVLGPALIFSAFVLFANPLILIIVLGLLGHTRRTSFMAGITMAQISEFSMILITMGFALGHVDQSTVTMIILIGVITMAASTYLISESEKIYPKLKKYLKIFEREKPIESAYNVQEVHKDHIVIVGADRTGRALIPFFVKRDIPFLVVDFNPSVFTKLTADKVPVIYGDISDPEIIDLISLQDARMVISTIGDLGDNLFLLERIRKLSRKPITLFTIKERSDGLRLYEKGADYVLVPQRIAGEHIKHVLNTYGISSERIRKLGKANFNRLMTM